MPPSLSTLPEEVIKLILEQFSSRIELAKICLLYKQLCRAATGPLYHTITISISRLNTSSNTLSVTSSRHLCHVRELYILEDKERYSAEDHVPALNRLLRALPRDVLTAFSLRTARVVNIVTRTALHGRQSNLRNLELYSYGNLPLALYSGPDVDFTIVSQLSVILNTRLDLQRALPIMAAAHNITTLSVRFPSNRKGSPPVSHSRALADILMELEAPACRRAIKKLNLQRYSHSPRNPVKASFNVASSAQVLTELGTLRLEDCELTGALLEALAPQLSKLHSLYVIRALDNAQEPVQMPISTILRQASGLRTLYTSYNQYGSG